MAYGDDDDDDGGFARMIMKGEIGDLEFVIKSLNIPCDGGSLGSPLIYISCTNKSQKIVAFCQNGSGFWGILEEIKMAC